MPSKRKNKNNIVAIFAHPDDEAFGPAGTIAKLAEKNNIYLICATKGEAGEGDTKKLAAVRSRELRESAKILKVKEIYFLGFKDGTLSNSLYHKMAEKIEKILKKLKPNTIITFEPRGVSGHIDHITVSMVSSYLFDRLSFIKKIMYYCISEKNREKLFYKYFIYFPPGYKKSQIDEIIDISANWETKIKAMKAHISQWKDAQWIIKKEKDLPREECFLTKTK